MTGARELERTEWGTIVYVCEEGHKGVKKKEWQQTKKNQGRKGRGVEKEEAKQQRSEREMTRGVEGWRERWKKRERKVSRQRRRKKRDSESSWIVGERERGGGGMSPMAATHHSQLNDAIFFPFPASFPWERVEGEGVRPAPNQTGSYRVHIVQVGLSSSREMFVCSHKDRLDEVWDNKKKKRVSGLRLIKLWWSLNSHARKGRTIHSDLKACAGLFF